MADVFTQIYKLVTEADTSGLRKLGADADKLAALFKNIKAGLAGISTATLNLGSQAGKDLRPMLDRVEEIQTALRQLSQVGAKQKLSLGVEPKELDALLKKIAEIRNVISQQVGGQNFASKFVDAVLKIGDAAGVAVKAVENIGIAYEKAMQGAGRLSAKTGAQQAAQASASRLATDFTKAGSLQTFITDYQKANGIILNVAKAQKFVEQAFKDTGGVLNSVTVPEIRRLLDLYVQTQKQIGGVAREQVLLGTEQRRAAADVRALALAQQLFSSGTLTIEQAQAAYNKLRVVLRDTAAEQSREALIVKEVTAAIKASSAAVEQFTVQQKAANEQSKRTATLFDKGIYAQNKQALIDFANAFGLIEKVGPPIQGILRKIALEQAKFGGDTAYATERLKQEIRLLEQDAKVSEKAAAAKEALARERKFGQDIAGLQQRVKIEEAVVQSLLRRNDVEQLLAKNANALSNIISKVTTETLKNNRSVADAIKLANEMANASLKEADALRAVVTAEEKQSAVLAKEEIIKSSAAQAQAAGIVQRYALTVDRAVRSQINWVQISKDLARVLPAVSGDVREQERVLTALVTKAKEMSALPNALGDRGVISNLGQLYLLKQVVDNVTGAFGSSIRAFRDFEDRLIEVRKTAGATKAEMDALGQSIFEIGQRTAVPVNDLAEIAGILGQLGVLQSRPGQAAVDFANEAGKAIQLIAEVIRSTSLGKQEAAETYGQLATVFRKDVEAIRRELVLTTNTSADATDAIRSLFGAMNELANATLATEEHIRLFLKNFGGVAETAGLATETIFGLSGAVANLGLSQQVAGTALSRLFGDATKKSEVFADALNISVDAWRQLFFTKPDEAVLRFLKALNEASIERRDQIMRGLSAEQRFKNVLLGLANSYQDLLRNIEIAGDSQRNYLSIQREAEKFTTTFSSAVERLKNSWVEAAKAMEPAFNLIKEGIGAVASAVSYIVSAFTKLPESVRTVVTVWGSLVVGITALTLTWKIFIKTLSFAGLDRTLLSWGGAAKLLTLGLSSLVTKGIELVRGNKAIAASSAEAAAAITRQTVATQAAAAASSKAATAAQAQAASTTAAGSAAAGTTTVIGRFGKGLLGAAGSAASLGVGLASLVASAKDLSEGNILAGVTEGLLGIASAAAGFGLLKGVFAAVATGAVATAGAVTALAGISVGAVATLVKINMMYSEAGDAATRFATGTETLADRFARGFSRIRASVQSTGAEIFRFFGADTLADLFSREEEHLEALERNIEKQKTLIALAKERLAVELEVFSTLATVSGASQKSTEAAINAIKKGVITLNQAYTALRESQKNSADDFAKGAGQIELARKGTEALTRDLEDLALAYTKAGESRIAALGAISSDKITEAQKKFIENEKSRVKAIIRASLDTGTDEEKDALVNKLNTLYEAINDARKRGLDPGYKVAGGAFTDSPEAKAADELLYKSQQLFEAKEKLKASQTDLNGLVETQNKLEAAIYNEKLLSEEELLKQRRAIHEGDLAALKNVGAVEATLAKLQEEYQKKAATASLDKVEASEALIRNEKDIARLEREIAASGDRLNRLYAERQDALISGTEAARKSTAKRLDDERAALQKNQQALDRQKEAREILLGSEQVATKTIEESNKAAANTDKERAKLKERIVELAVKEADKLREANEAALLSLQTENARALAKSAKKAAPAIAFQLDIGLLEAEFKQELDKLKKLSGDDAELTAKLREEIFRKYLAKQQEAVVDYIENVTELEDQAAKKQEKRIERLIKDRKEADREQLESLEEREKKLKVEIEALTSLNSALKSIKASASAAFGDTAAIDTFDEKVEQLQAHFFQVKKAAEQLGDAFSDSKLGEAVRGTFNAIRKSAFEAGRAIGKTAVEQGRLQAELQKGAGTQKGKAATAFLQQLRDVFSREGLTDEQRGFIVQKGIESFKDKFGKLEGKGPSLEDVLAVAEQIISVEGGKLKTEKDITTELANQESLVARALDMTKEQGRELQNILDRRIQISKYEQAIQSGTITPSIFSARPDVIKGKNEKALAGLAYPQIPFAAGQDQLDKQKKAVEVLDIEQKLAAIRKKQAEDLSVLALAESEAAKSADLAKEKLEALAESVSSTLNPTLDSLTDAILALSNLSPGRGGGMSALSLIESTQNLQRALSADQITRPIQDVLQPTLARLGVSAGILTTTMTQAFTETAKLNNTVANAFGTISERARALSAQLQATQAQIERGVKQ